MSLIDVKSIWDDVVREVKKNEEHETVEDWTHEKREVNATYKQYFGEKQTKLSRKSFELLIYKKCWNNSNVKVTKNWLIDVYFDMISHLIWGHIVSHITSNEKFLFLL